MTAESSGQRNIAIYLLKERTGATNSEIGGFVDGLTHSAVAKIYKKMTENIKGDRKPGRNLYQAQDQVDDKKERLIEEIEARLKQKMEKTALFTVRWSVI